MVVILMGTLECSLLSPTAWRVIMTALKALDFYQAQQADHDAKLATRGTGINILWRA